MSQGIFIDGAWHASAGERFDVVCPSTEQVIGQAGEATAVEVDAAVSAARQSFSTGPWRRLDVTDRAAVIDAAATGLAARKAELARLITSEMGAPLAMSTATVDRAVDTMRSIADLARTTSLEELRRHGAPALVVREPIGVVAAIAPWNGPIGMAVGKIVPALLAGCSVVFKPAPETPLDVAILVDALREAGVPAGVLNVVTGRAATGKALVEHAGVDKVSFTGSTSAGRYIGSVCGSQFKRTQLELGGKSAAIVLDDADLEQVRAGLSVGCFMNSGQACVALSRVLAPRRLYDEVVALLGKAADAWQIGDPFAAETTMGPLVSAAQRERVESYMQLGVDAGATLVRGGGRPPGLSTGWYVEPTVFADVDNSMRIAREEIFGPVAVVIPYDDVDEAVAIANDSEYGLHGAVFSTNPTRALDVARSVRTGTFSLNNFVYNNRVPFGGVKDSGIGREGGLEGFLSYFELKTINLDAAAEQLLQ
ncbi:aldehyde dehydrogenase [Mycobacterium sp.]|uniref:aldehyde dehydrogenase n=1 Tax=Mycobacterium sp. TaxID=1785 RepID=UPI003BAE9104